MTPANRLRAGEVVLLDTDTLPGLHALALLPASSEALRQLKGASDDRPFLLLFESSDQAFRYGSCAAASDTELLRQFWPGPITAVLTPSAIALPDWIGPDGGIAVRVPAARDLLSILGRCGGPLYSTSANRHGEAAATTLEEASRRFPELHAYASGDASSGEPSTVVDLRISPPRVLRQGACGWPPPFRRSSP